MYIKSTPLLGKRLHENVFPAARSPLIPRAGKGNEVVLCIIAERLQTANLSRNTSPIRCIFIRKFSRDLLVLMRICVV